MKSEYISLPKLKWEIRRADLSGDQVFLCCEKEELSRIVQKRIDCSSCVQRKKEGLHIYQPAWAAIHLSL